jgi:FG-GAP-like repeat
MRRLLLILAAGGALGAARDYADTHPPSGVSVRSADGARHYEAVVPGALLAWAAPRDAAGGRLLFLLAAPEGAPDDRRTLYRLDLEGRRLTALRDDLEAGLDRLAAVDLDGDGSDELVLGGPGRFLEAARGGREIRPLYDAPGLDLGAAVAVRGDAPEPGQLTLAGVGVLRRFATEGGVWRPAASLPLPLAASRQGQGIRLTSPPSTLLRLAAGDAYAVGPEAVGDRRWRCLLTPAGGGPALEAWGRLPGAERVQWSWFEVIDGRPVLVLTTNSADRLGLFERQQLRLFSLREDRTRTGVGPWLAAPTTSRRWQRVEPFVADLDGDGDDDFVVAQVDGLGGGGLVVEAFVNDGRHGFPTRRRSSLARAPEAWHFGSDLTGDGLPDLVLVSDGEIAVYETLAGGGRLLARRPRWAFAGPDIARGGAGVEIGSGGAVATGEGSEPPRTPHLLDLDGDGRAEVLVADPPRWGFGRLRVVFLPAGGH